ncbi:MAG TPA: chemotaxis protein CheW, partial [Armatimonadota bacterium]|nr:chemotaxis protein CheW [Armatimonadota bacterium]
HPFIIGITNLHGTIIPIIDLHKRFDFPPVEYTETARVVVVKSDEFMAGLIVDTMVGTVRLAGVDIEQFSSRLSSDKNDYIYGVGKHDHGIILLLSVPQLFCQQDVERLQSLLQRA